MDRNTLLKTLSSATTSPSGHRPIMTMVNGDNTWLISIPRPSSSSSKKTFYHILQDPWLAGDAIALSSWFLVMRHPVKEALDSTAAIEGWIEEVETAAGGAKDEGEDSWLDAVLVTHVNTDHMHEATLRTCDPSTRVFAAAQPAAIMEGWKHFERITLVPDFVRGRDARWPAADGMPGWLSVFRLPDECGVVPLLYHAIVFSFASADGKGEEMILYSPHGVDPDVVEAARDANPGVSVLAMVHPLHKTGLFEKGTTLGVTNGLKIERRVEPRYWLGTHDDKIRYSGVMSWLLSHGKMTLEQGLEEEERETGRVLRRPNVVEVGNGESYILA